MNPPIYNHAINTTRVEISNVKFTNTGIHVPLRSQECRSLQCHRFETKVISNLNVASMSASINNSLVFFCHLGAQCKIRTQITDKKMRDKTNQGFLDVM